MLIYTLVLVSVGSLWAQPEPPKVLVDFSNQEVTPDDIVNALNRTGRGALIAVFGNIRFASNSATILPDSIQFMNAVGKALESPSLAQDRFRIEGHTDNVGNAISNMRLSVRRAQSVKAYLTQHFAIVPQRLTAAGRGQSEPIASNESPEGQAKNRRVEFVKQLQMQRFPLSLPAQ
jgi:outer membrane protein OmpA-like peptidoglycan-associated protein